MLSTSLKIQMYSDRFKSVNARVNAESGVNTPQEVHYQQQQSLLFEFEESLEYERFLFKSSPRDQLATDRIILDNYEPE